MSFYAKFVKDGFSSKVSIIAFQTKASRENFIQQVLVSHNQDLAYPIRQKDAIRFLGKKHWNEKLCKAAVSNQGKFLVSPHLCSDILVSLNWADEMESQESWVEFL